MIRCRPALVAFAACCFVSTSHADPLVDAVVDEFFTELSKRYAYVRLRAPEVDDYIGHAFYVVQSDVKCASDFAALARSGVGIQVTKAADLRETKGLPKPETIKSWTGVRLSSLITEGVEARLSAKLPDKAAEVRAAASALRASNAQILVASRSVPSIKYRQAAERNLRELGVAKVSDIEAGASGVVVPVGELIVQKFEFDSELLAARNLSLSAKFLELFGLSVAGAQSKGLKSGYIQATNSVLAFKPITLLFEQAGCGN